ncbi:NAC domain-containing protein 68 [Linum perenne]
MAAMNPPCNLAEFARQLMPPGMKFCPTDQELIVNYLYRKIRGGLTSFQTEIVKDCDLYGEEEPWEIWDNYKADTVVDMEQNLYFFTRLKTKNTSGKRILRRVGKSDGTWHGEDAGSKIKCSVVVGGGGGEELFLLGYKKRFNYRNPKSDQHGLWIMHEYSLSGTEYVICRLKYSKSLIPSSLRLAPPPHVQETRLLIGNTDEVSVVSVCGESSKQGGKNGQVELEEAKKGDLKLIAYKTEKSDSNDGFGIEKVKKSKDGSENEVSSGLEQNDNGGEMISQKKVSSVPAVENTDLESQGSNDGEKNGQMKVKLMNIDREVNNQKKGVAAAASAQVKNGLDFEQVSSDFIKMIQAKGKNDDQKAKSVREMSSQKKGAAAASSQGKNCPDPEQGSGDFEKNGEARGKKNMGREMHNQKNRVATSVQVKNCPDYEQDSSDFEKIRQAKGMKNIDREMNNQKNRAATSVQVKNGPDHELDSSDFEKIRQAKGMKNIDREMNSQKKGVAAASAQGKNCPDHEQGSGDFETKMKNMDREMNSQKKGAAAQGKKCLDHEQGSSDFETKKKNIDREMNNHKKGAAATASAPTKNCPDHEQGSADFETKKKNMDREMNNHKKGIAAATAASAPTKNCPDNEQGSSDFEKNVNEAKAKTVREMNDRRKIEKVTSVNALMNMVAAKPLPKIGSVQGKRPRADQECTEEDESASKKDKRFEILMEVLGLNK